MRIISEFSERYFCHFYYFFSKKVEKMVCLESVGKLLFLPLLPVLHNLFQCGKSGSQFCHFYQQKVWKKSETVGEVVKVAKISSKKVPPRMHLVGFPRWTLCTWRFDNFAPCSIKSLLHKFGICRMLIYLCGIFQTKFVKD